MMFEDHIEIEAEPENYFVSMTDMMVGLIFIFILILMYYALQFRDVTDQLAGANTTRTRILQKIETSLKAKGVPVTIDTQNGVLRLPDAILFDSSHADLKPDGEKAVTHLAEALSDVLPCYTDTTDGAPRRVDCAPTPHKIESLYIEGHTDIDPLTDTSHFKDNLDLSAARATATYREVTQQKPMLAKLCARNGPKCEPILSVSGYGPNRPAVDGKDDAAKRSNRRIAIRIIMVTPDAGLAAMAVSHRLAAK